MVCPNLFSTFLSTAFTLISPIFWEESWLGSDNEVHDIEHKPSEKKIVFIF